MWELITLLLGLIVFLIGTGVWQALRGQHREPQTPRQRFERILVDNLGLDPARLEPSAFLLEGPMADELDITDLFLEIEDEFGIKLADSEVLAIVTVGPLWELVERKVSSSTSPAK